MKQNNKISTGEVLALYFISLFISAIAIASVSGTSISSFVDITLEVLLIVESIILATIIIRDICEGNL